MKDEQGMLKQFGPDQWDGLPTDGDKQIKVASTGLGFCDRKTAENFASPELLHWLSRMDTNPDCVYVHKIAMGCSDKYGPNRWGDGFRADVLDRDCPTFEQYAKAYRNHKSKSDDPYFGRPKIARFRKPTGVVELVTEYYGTDKVASANGGQIADKELEELAKHGSIAVSMGSKVPGDQCFPAGTLVWTANGLTPIEQLRVGDAVVTHLARLRRIKQTGQRLHRGQMVYIKPLNHLQAIITSDEHPYYVLRQVDVRQPHGRRRDDLSRYRPDWIPAKDIQPGDFVLAPVFDNEPVDSLDMARLFGCYAGNGSRIIQKTGKKKDGPYRLMGFAISGNLNQPEIMQNIVELIERLAVNAPTIKHEPDRSAYDLRTYDQQLANRLVSECGSLCHNKRVPAYLAAASIQEKLAFIGGLIDTDGSVDLKSGAIRIPLSTEQLVYETYLLGLSCGIRGSISQYTGTGFGGIESSVQVTCLSIAASHYAQLASHSWKVRNWGCARRASGVAFNYICDGVEYVAIEVESVATTTDEVVVYNLSVVEDESYVAEGVAVHNCVICGNWAPKRAMYCEAKSRGGTCELFGCKRGMLKVAADGRQQYVDNPTNLFYDISYVGRGADPIAHGLVLPLGKLASADSLDEYLKVADYFPSNLIGVEQQLTENARKMLKLAQVFMDLEAKYANYTPDTDVDLGMVYGVDYTDHTNVIHSSLPKVAKIAVRELARADICPDFESFAKAAGYSSGKIASMKPIVADMYTQLSRQRAITSVVNSADFSEIYLPNLVTSKTACIHDGCNQASILARGLSGNAEGAQLAAVPRLQASQTIPDIVAKYAAFKLAWAVHNPKIDPWRMNVLVKRELVTLANEPTK